MARAGKVTHIDKLDVRHVVQAWSAAGSIKQSIIAKPLYMPRDNRLWPACDFNDPPPLQFLCALPLPEFYVLNPNRFAWRLSYLTPFLYSG